MLRSPVCPTLPDNLARFWDKVPKSGKKKIRNRSEKKKRKEKRKRMYEGTCTTLQVWGWKVDARAGRCWHYRCSVMICYAKLNAMQELFAWSKYSSEIRSAHSRQSLVDRTGLQMSLHLMTSRFTAWTVSCAGFGGITVRVCIRIRTNTASYWKHTHILQCIRLPVIWPVMLVMHQDQLSLLSLWSRQTVNRVPAFMAWLVLGRGAFTCALNVLFTALMKNYNAQRPSGLIQRHACFNLCKIFIHVTVVVYDFLTSLS